MKTTNEPIIENGEYLLSKLPYVDFIAISEQYEPILAISSDIHMEIYRETKSIRITWSHDIDDENEAFDELYELIFFYDGNLSVDIG